MKKVCLFVIYLYSILLNAQNNQPENSYYKSFNWSLRGTELKQALAQKITSTHTKILDYAGAENALKIVDLDPTDATNTNLLLIYGFSKNICPSASADDNDHRRRNKNSDGGGNTCQWNREHVYPKALGTPNLGETGAGADAHHLRACDVQRNSNRSNAKFGEGTGNSGYVNTFWYPGDEWKGDVARNMMYLYLRYGNQCLPKNVGNGKAVQNDSNMIDLFLKWNAEDPVSQYEDNRNTYLANTSNTYGQGNRNPFIDNPYLATLIWGGTPAQNRWPFLSNESFEKLENIAITPNPSTGIFTVNIAPETDNLKIEVFTLLGQKITEYNTLNTKEITCEIKEKGIYIILLSKNNTSLVKKVIIN